MGANYPSRSYILNDLTNKRSNRNGTLFLAASNQGTWARHCAGYARNLIVGRSSCAHHSRSLAWWRPDIRQEWASAKELARNHTCKVSPSVAKAVKHTNIEMSLLTPVRSSIIGQCAVNLRFCYHELIYICRSRNRSYNFLLELPENPAKSGRWEFTWES